MATVELRYSPQNTAWFTANAAMILKAGEPAYHETTGQFKLGDGVTALSALSFLPAASSTPTLQQVLTAGSTLVGNNLATGTGDLTFGSLDVGIYESTIKYSGSTILHTSFDGVNTGLFTQTPNNNTFTKNITAPSVTSPLIIGGSAAGSVIQYKGTTGAGTSSVAAHQFLVGNNGSINKIGIYNDGSFSNFGVGTQTTSVFFGFGSGISNYTGIESAVFGNASAALMTAGNSNTIIGSVSARALTTGGTNTVLGSDCLAFNQTGTSNVAIGVQACNATTGNGNIGIGVQSLRNATTSALNLCIGFQSGLNLLTGSGYNTIIGNGSTLGITTGAYNTIIGAQVTGLSTSLSNNIILSDGQGNIKYQWDGTSNNFTGYLKTTVNTGVIQLREMLTVGAGTTAIYMTTSAPSTTNHALAWDGSSTYLNATGANSIYLQTGGANRVRVGSNFMILSEGVNLHSGTTTGSIIFNTTSQKGAFWGATPVVQPTTAFASATFVASAGTAVNDASTFDGYTLKQVVAALRAEGLLA